MTSPATAALDLAVANDGDNTVSVLLGNGDGTFQPQVTYAVGQCPDAIVAGDFTGDGRLDLAVANALDDTVSVLLGNGDGTFQPQVTYAVGADPDAIVAGDFNGDGRTRPGRRQLRSTTPCRCCWATATARSSPRSPTRWGRARSRSWRATSTATAAPTWPSPTYDSTTPCRCCWATATAPSSPRSPTRWGRTPTRSWRATSPATAALDLAVANDDAMTTPCRCCWATATARSSPRSPTRWGRSPIAIVAGDFTGDGQLDLAVAQLDGDDTRVGAAGQRRRHLPAPGHLRGGVGPRRDRGG